MKRKSKSSEPSLRERLSARFLKDFDEDYAAFGADVIKQLREKYPDRYIEQAARLIAQSEPPGGIFDEAKTMRDIGIGLMKQVGVSEENITDPMIEAAIAANDKFVAELERIAALYIGLEIGMENADEYRELRS
jgi:hypothetical protein